MVNTKRNTSKDVCV